MIGWQRRREGGVVAVVAAFWLGFLCGGGGGPSGAAMLLPLAEAQRQEPPPTAPPDEPALAPDQRAPVQPESRLTDAETNVASGPVPPLVQDRPRKFTAGVGVILNFVRPEGESAFEEAMARVAEALAASESEDRRRQADGWNTYRAEEPLADGVILYVSWLDPAVPGADYWIPGILSEAFPTEAQALYETYAGAFADGQILLNLIPVAGP